jgi:hypothetical protein
MNYPEIRIQTGFKEKKSQHLLRVGGGFNGHGGFCSSVDYIIKFRNMNTIRLHFK